MIPPKRMEKLNKLGLWGHNLYQPEFRDLMSMLGDNNFSLTFNGRRWICHYKYDKDVRWYIGRSIVSAESALAKTIIRYYETSGNNNTTKGNKLE